MRSAEQLAGRLRAAGGKLTPQRLFLFRALEGTTAHPTAEDLHEQVRADLPMLSLATVYKTLSELVGLGELRLVKSGDGRAHYDPNTEPHAHLVCRACGKLEDAPAGLVTVRVSPEMGDFLVTDRRVTLEGYCAACR